MRVVFPTLAVPQMDTRIPIRRYNFYVHRVAVVVLGAMIDDR